ncbi:MAG: hypothetical protein ACK5A0_11075 [Polaromonas sp.]|jgi:hypothetical protein
MRNDDVGFSRTAETKELRGDAPTDLVVALDALALARDMTRNAYVVDVLGKHVLKELHRHSVEANALRGNPMMSAMVRTRADACAPTGKELHDHR